MRWLKGRVGYCCGFVSAMLSIPPQAGAHEINHQAMRLSTPLPPVVANLRAMDATASESAPWSPQTMHGVNFNEARYYRAMAAWALQQVNASLPQIHDPWVVDSVYRISSQLNAQVRAQPLLAVPVIKDSAINAFAVAGGLIAINTGTLLAAEDLDEGVSVLAHEIAHLSQRHYERSQDNKSKLIAMQLGGLLAALAAASVSGDAAATMLIGTQTLAADSAAAHSRAHEREADRLGMQIMARSGYDVHAMPRFFERLARQSQLNSTANAFVPSFVRSHPLTAERLSEAHSRAATYPATQRTGLDTHAAAFDLLTWRIHYLLGDTDLSALSVAAKHSTGAKLALIAKLADLRRFDEADMLWQQITALPSQARQDPLFCITEAHIAYERGDFGQAAAILTPCHRIYPERRDLQLYLADALIYAGESKRALALLTPLTKVRDHDVLAWDLYQRAYEQQPTDDANAQAQLLRARAKKALWRGDYHSSLQSLALAHEQAKAANDFALMSVLDKDKLDVQAAQNFKP